MTMEDFRKKASKTAKALGGTLILPEGFHRGPVPKWRPTQIIEEHGKLLKFYDSLRVGAIAEVDVGDEKMVVLGLNCDPFLLDPDDALHEKDEGTNVAIVMNLSESEKGILRERGYLLRELD